MEKFKKEFMDRAIELSREAVEQGGGPFGAVVVKDGQIIGEGRNRVVPDFDPTAHAEVMAIRDAAKNGSHHWLEGCVLYTSCEPCPLCLSAMYWAHIDAFYYANTRDEAAEVGFDDAFIYEQIPLEPSKRKMPGTHVASIDAISVFGQWATHEGRVHY